MIKIVVAHDRNRVIGLNNALPWKLPKDLAYVKRLTLGTPIVMGRKTFESIGRVLPGRENIILTTSEVENNNVTVVADADIIRNRFSRSEDCFIFGGQMIYELFLPVADSVYLTFVDEEFEGDTFFPQLSKEEWEVVAKSPNQRDGSSDLDYYFIEYRRRKR